MQLEVAMSSPTSRLKNEIVRAGAGAGKTTILTQRIFDFLTRYKEENGSWPKVVATTFTKKATQELEERLLLKALELQNFELIKYISESSGLFISTIHGVLNRFLQTYGYMVGIESGFEVITEKSSLYLYKKIIRDIVSENPEQVQPLLRVYSFKQLISITQEFSNWQSQYPESKAFLINDFKKKFEDKKKWLQINIAEVCDEIESNIEQKSWLTFAEKFKKLSVVDWPDAQDYVDALAEMGRKPSKSNKIPEEINTLLEGCLQIIKKDFSTPAYQKSFWQSSEQLCVEFELFYNEFQERYKAYKLSQSLIEVNDLENYTFQITKDNPELTRLFSAEWDYWLVDEYQDTSPLQVKILENFIGSSPVFIVGDPQQSIYLFRGARSEVFDQQENKISSEGGEKNFLQKNYRSRPELLMYFNDFFQQVGPQFKPMQPRADEFDPSAVVASVAQLPLNEIDKEPKDQFERNYIVGEIFKLIDQGVQWDDICILSRTNGYLKKMAQELKQYNIPINLYSSGGFSGRREIIDALSFLKFLVNPYDNINCVRLLRSPWFTVSDDDLVSTLMSREEGVWSTLKNCCPDHKTVLRLKAALKSCDNFGVSFTFKNELLNSGFVDYSLSYDSTGRRESNFWKLVQKLADAERRPGFNYIEFIEDILGGNDADILSDEGDAVASLEPNCINMMTVHASKGLQYKYVFIPQMNKRPMVQKSSSKKEHVVFDEKLKKWSLYSLASDGKLSPTVFHMDYVKELEERELLESQRLLYVSLTRASVKVYLSFTEKLDKNSWASLLDIPDEGLHTTDHYSVEVVKQEVSKPAINIGVRNQINQQEAPSPFNPENFEQDFLFQKISVSEVLKTTDSSMSQPKVKDEEQVKGSLQGLKKSSDGSLMHRVFELLKFHSKEELTSLVNKWFPDKVDAVLKSIDYISSLEEPNLLEIIKQGEVEWGFQLKTEQGLIEGQIDLWGEDDEFLWIVDYKSGSERFVDKAFEQLKYYSKAIKELRPDKPIKLMVVYPSAQKTFIK